MKNRSICDQISAPLSRNSRVANATSEENCHEKTKGSLDNTTGGRNTCRAGCYASLCGKSAFLCGHSRFERIVLPARLAVRHLRICQASERGRVCSRIAQLNFGR